MKTSIIEKNDIPSDEIDLGEFVAMLWSGKWWIALSCAIGFAFGNAWVLNTPPTYQADALIQIEDKSASLALPDGLADLVSSNNKSGAELQLLHSRLTLGTAVAKMHLDWVAEPVLAPFMGYAIAGNGLPLPEWNIFQRYARPNDAISLDYLKVPPEWLGQMMNLTSEADDSYTLNLPNGEVIRGKANQLASNEERNFAIIVAKLTGKPGRAYTVGQLDELTAINKLDAGLDEAEQGRGTGVVKLTFKGSKRQLVRRTLDAIANAFHEQNLARSSAEAQRSLEFVESQLPDAEAKLREAENSLNSYKAAQHSVDLNFETQSLLSQTQTTEEKLRELAQSEDDIKRKYAPDHPVYKQLLDTRRAFQDHLDQLNTQIAALPETQKQVLNMTRDMKTAQATFDSLTQRSQELSVLKASTIGNVRIVDTAATSLGQIAPKKSTILTLSVVLAGVIGCLLFVLREKLRRGIDGIEEIEQLGVPVFATISLFLDDRKGHKSLSMDSSRSDIISRDMPESILVEEFKSLRTSLHFGMLDAANKSLAITSGAPDAGKSFISANIAAITAAVGAKVCLVDADLRRGRQRLRFGLSRSKTGLSEYLSKNIPLEDILHVTDVPGLTFINTGKFPPNPSELLIQPKFNQLVSDLTSKFDLVVIDCPPVLAVTDATLIGRVAGVVFVVARHQKTEIAELTATLRALETGGITVKGGILNAFNRRKIKSYGRYAYKYKYNYSYNYKSTERETERENL